MVLASKFFLPTKKENQVPADLKKSHRLMLRSGMISQLSSGLYFWLPFGKLLLDKLTSIIHKHARKMGFNDCMSTHLHPAELWKETARYDAYGKEMMKLKDRHDRELVLGPTAEETFTDAVRKFVKHKKELPVNLYNIQTKFRDEIRPVGGVDRAREFLMFDAYSFHSTQEESIDFYWKIFEEYKQIFTEMELNTEAVEADCGEIGGSLSHEFMIKNEFEIGHIFHLGTKYSTSMNLLADGEPVFMGCYGIGISRLASVIIELFGEENSIKWPKSVAPFSFHIVAPKEVCTALDSKISDGIYYEDRNIRFGEKLAIADLIGAPNRVILGEKGLAEGFLEFNNKKIEIKNPETDILELITNMNI